MVTWTLFAERLNERIKREQTKMGIYAVHYEPQYRYLSLSGDGLLMFRAIIRTDGKMLQIVAVNDKHGVSRDADVVIDGKRFPLQAKMEIAPEQFVDAVMQYVCGKGYSVAA